MSQQRTVSIPTEEEEPEDPQVVEEEKKTTSAFFYEYISKRANKDQELETRDAKIIEEQREQAVQKVEDVSAVNVAAALADLGDRIDAEYHEEMNRIIELTGSPESAYSTFLYVVRSMFTWDENGRAVINMGRIAALMAYCYNLCKTYIMKITTGKLIVSFMGLVSGWLFKFLLKAKFYEWLQSQGGWGQLILSASNSVQSYGGSLFLVGSVAVLAIMAYSYFRSR